MNRLLTFIFLLSFQSIIGQHISGIVLDSKSKQPIQFANIGIAGKNIGTVSDSEGKFNLAVNSQLDTDTLLFSIVGYQSLPIKIADLRKTAANEILLYEKVHELEEVVIKPKVFKEQTLGVTTKSSLVSAGFIDNKLGYELGILMKVKKTAFLKKVNINISFCSYDSLFYRLNIYKVNGKMDFENILREPIYVNMAKSSVKDEIQIDLESKNIVVEGDFLITLEHVKNLGKGHLYFCAGLMDKTYYRKTSQDNWETKQAGISISMIADVEK